MFPKSVILLAAVAVLVPQTSGKTCSSEFNPRVSGSRCELQCGAQKCICSNETSSSSQSFNSCLQKCDTTPFGFPNTTVTSCPDMKCAYLETCFQTCGTDSCSMECKAKKRCNQECGNGCVKAVCSAETCYQQCTNCTMECTSETKECDHLCTGGVCYSKCAAQKCIRRCIEGGADDCKIIYSSSPKHTLVPSLLLVFFVAYFLA